MEIEIASGGRRFGRDWIFRNIQVSIPSGSHCTIVGPNGSGKSTLLQCISGFLELSEGSLHYRLNGASISDRLLYKHCSLASPYLDIFEDLSLKESIDFQRRFRPFRSQLTTEAIIEVCELKAHADKAVRNFSSGMRQRVKLALAILTDSELLMLDEPTSNLDRASVAWYRALLTQNSDGRTVIVSTNHNTDEYLRSDLEIDILDYK